MAGRIGRALETALRERRVAFVPFLTSGFPDLAESTSLAGALCDEGADVLELGIPFSDPIADGPTIQRTTEAALRAGATVATVLEQVRRLRERHETPLVLMSYLNPILRYGHERFAEDARASGVDGLILVDLPPEAEPSLWTRFKDSRLDTIALIAPTTDEARLPRIVERATGFLYVVARLGVTGRGDLDAAVGRVLARCREISPLPRCLGFGVDLATPLQAHRGRVEGVVVGSALLDAIAPGADARAREDSARAFARAFREKLTEIAPAA